MSDDAKSNTNAPNTSDKEAHKEQFLFYVPDFISKCEQQALFEFFREYFEALDQCKDVNNEEIIKRKKFFMKSLEKNYRSLEEHRKRFNSVLQHITDRCIRPCAFSNVEKSSKTRSVTI